MNLEIGSHLIVSIRSNKQEYIVRRIENVDVSDYSGLGIYISPLNDMNQTSLLIKINEEWEVYNPNTNDSLPDHTITFIPDCSSFFEIYTEITNGYDDTANTLIKMICSYQITQDLAKQAFLTSPNKSIHLSIIPEKVITYFPICIGGTCVPREKLIRIRFKSNDHLIERIPKPYDEAKVLASLRRTALWQMFSTFIFELVNLKNFAANEIDEIFKSSQTVDQYALAMETKENQTVYEHHNIAQTGIKLYNWPDVVDKYKNIEQTISKQEERGHTEFYRKEYLKFIEDTLRSNKD